MKRVTAPALRQSLLAYVDARSAVVRPKTLDKLISALALFGEFIGEHFAEVTSLRGLERRHLEAYIAWTATRGDGAITTRPRRSVPPPSRTP